MEELNDKGQWVHKLPKAVEEGRKKEGRGVGMNAHKEQRRNNTKTRGTD